MLVNVFSILFGAKIQQKNVRVKNDPLKNHPDIIIVCVFILRGKVVGRRYSNECFYFY